MSGATDADGGAAYYPVMQTDLCATGCDIRSTATQNMNYSLAVHQSAPFFEMPGYPTPLYPTGEVVYARPSSGQGEVSRNLACLEEHSPICNRFTIVKRHSRKCDLLFEREINAQYVRISQ